MIEVRTLGPVAVTVDGADAPRELTWRKNLALLVYLARSPHRTRTREHLATLLWGDKVDEAARHSLNEALRTLRRHGGEGAIVSDGDRVACSEAAVALDVERLEEALEVEAWEKASGLVGGVFLEGFGVPDASAFEDWMSAERRLWTDRSVTALAGRLEELLAAGRLEEARGMAGRIRVLDPRSAAGVRGLMRVKALSGERAAALASFEAWRDELASELGIEPDPETQRLADRIRRERSWTVAPEAESRARPAPLVGREEELGSVAGALRQAREEGRAAVVAVEGDPGTGRSRLLEEAARRARLAGAVTLEVRAVPADREEDHGTMLALCRDALIDAPGLVAAQAGALAAVSREIPAWSERFAEEIEGADPLPLDRALSGLLEAVLEEQPVVICVDDAEHLDDATRRALEVAVRDHGERALALLLGHAGGRSGDAVDALASRIGRDVAGTTVRLEPLGQDALRELVTSLLAEYGPEQADRLARRLAVDTGGLPALAVRVVEAVRDGLELTEGSDAWPAPDRTLDHTMPGELPGSITAAVRVGFRTLTAEAQRIVAAASVLGPRVDAPTLGRATGLEGEPLERALDEAEWRRWLASEPRGYAFVARVVGEIVARDMLTEGERRRYRERGGLSGEI